MLCRGGSDRAPAAVAAVMSSVYATLTRLARQCLCTRLGEDREDAADELAGEYIRCAGKWGLMLLLEFTADKRIAGLRNGLQNGGF